MSSINPNNIDGTYPIAGQDNDSQGFRDNFTNIKNNFTFSKTEIEDLQNNAILKTALSGTTLDNNLNNAQLYGAQIRKFTETREDLGTQVGSVPISWNDAHFQTLAITGNTTISLSGWPTSGFWTYLVLDVTPSTDNLGLTLPAAVSVNASNIQGFSGNTVTLAKGNVTYRFEFSTYNGGTNIAIRDLFRNYDAPIDFTTLNATTVNATGNVLATGLSVFGNARIGSLLTPGAGHSIIGNVTQSGAGTVFYNTTGNVLASEVVASTITTNALVNNGNIIIQDPIFADKFGSNLTVKGTIEFKAQDQSNNASVNTTTKSLTLAPGGDQFLLLNINANCAIGYNAIITQGHQTTVHVKNSAGGLAYVIVPNNNTTTGNAFIGLAAGQVGTFVFTSYNTDAANVMVTVTR